MATKTQTNLRSKELFNNAKMRADEFNLVIKQINNSIFIPIVLGEQTLNKLNDQQLATLQTLFSVLETKSKLADTSWERYADYCTENDLDILDIEYLSTYQFHTTD